MMNEVGLTRAIVMAEQFIRCAEAARNVVKAQKYYGRSPETAAARRMSMDLTRELAKLRKYNP